MNQSYLLTTKLYLPPPCQTLVHRPRLTAALSKALERCLTLVSAPAGYGKTTLVSGWLREIDVPSAWLSLDEDDNDPMRFLQYFTAALQKIVPAMQAGLPGLLQGVQPAPLRVLVNLLINEIAEHAPPFVLVLDDFHLIHDQSILEMLTYLLEHAPPQLHLVLLSRTDPPLLLSRLRVRSQLLEIRADQLRFTLEEIAVFLDEVMGVRLSAGDLAAIEARTEGWIAGLQLASIALQTTALQTTALQSQPSMQGEKDIHSFVSAFTGSHYYVMDYLVEEVLKLQPEYVRSFLLQTSILDRMCASLCAEVTGWQGNQSGGENSASLESPFSILDYLQHSNLFLIALDGERRWFRYHHLFGDVLNRRLELLLPNQIPELHRRASRWYEKNDFILSATHHALLAGDQDRAAQLVEQNGCLLLLRGEVTNLRKWIEAVESPSRAQPWLAILKAWALTLTGQLDPVEQILKVAERQISGLDLTSEVRTMLGSIAAARAYRASLRGEAHLIADFARQGLAYLTDDNPLCQGLRSLSTSLLGEASWMNGNLDEARRAYAEAALVGLQANNHYLVVIANSDLADVLIEQGQLRQAARILTETLQISTRPNGQSPPFTDRVYAGLSRVFYEWNRLETAAQYAGQCIEFCRKWGNVDAEAAGYVALARLAHAQCDPRRTREMIHAAEQLASEVHLSPRLETWVMSALARLWIAQGNIERPSHLIEKWGISIEDEIPYMREPESLVLLRLLLARGDQNAALALSERLLKQAEALNRTGQVIEILVLQALASQGKKDLVRAVAILERAIALAEPEGYARAFLDEGEPMLRLLKVSRGRVGGYIGQYAEKLLLASQGQRSEQGNLQRNFEPSTLQPEMLIEPLTPRELEVLKLIEAGSSNPVIAARLVISIKTVKRHISNIYEKLGVNSRTQAVSRGRELGIFE